MAGALLRACLVEVLAMLTLKQKKEIHTLANELLRLAVEITDHEAGNKLIDAAGLVLSVVAKNKEKEN